MVKSAESGAHGRIGCFDGSDFGVLDLLVALSTDSHSYLLAEGYEEALSDAEKSLGEKLHRLSSYLSDAEAQSSGGVRLQEMLAELGAPAAGEP